MRKLMFASALFATLALTSSAMADTTVQVDPGNMNGWTKQATGTATVGFEQGPATPPLGTGSAFLNVGSDGSSAAQLRNGDYAGTALADLTELSYWSYVDVTGSGGQAPYVILNVDYDGNGTTDDLLFFEPVYQTVEFCPSNPQAPIVMDTWQEWDALNGCWWSVNNTAGAGPGTAVKPLSVILAAEPDAAIATGTSGAVRLVAGFGAGAWDNFEGNVDAFAIGVSGDTTTYDFEAQPTSPESCKNGGWSNFTSPRTFKNQGDCIQYTKTGK